MPKIPAIKYDWKDVDEAYDGLWCEGPRSVREGLIAAIQRLPVPQYAMDSGEELVVPSSRVYERGRIANTMMLSVLVAWNLTDAEGAPVPLVKDLGETPEGTSASDDDAAPAAKKRTQAVREWWARAYAVLGEVPADVLNWLADEMMYTKKRKDTDKTADF